MKLNTIKKRLIQTRNYDLSDRKPQKFCEQILEVGEDNPYQDTHNRVQIWN